MSGSGHLEAQLQSVTVKEMALFGRVRGCIVVSLTALVAVAGCARSPEAQKARHLERGDKHFVRQQYREAIIEYRNALGFEPANVQAIHQLGLAHYQLGELPQAFGYLQKSKALDPANLDVRQKLATIHLLGGQPAEALQETAIILDKDAKNLDALALFAGAARTPQEISTAIRRLEAARRDFTDRAKLHLALGSLYLRQKALGKAENAFKDAVAREPKLVETHLALGNFYESKPDLAQAERALKAAAELGPTGSFPQLSLANFYLRTGKSAEGKRLLTEITQKAPGFLPAWYRVAEIALGEGRYDDTAKALQVLQRKNALDLNWLLLRGRMKLARGETAEATQDFQQVLRLEPRLASAHYQLALAHLRAGNAQQARTELDDATKADPNLTEASLVGAELDIQRGAVAPAIEALQKTIASRPGEIRAYRLLGRAYLSNREPIKATAAYRKIVELAPKDPQGPYLVGVALLAQGKRVEAQREFEASLSLAPAYLEPLAQLVSIALAEEKPDVAFERLQRQIRLVPNSGELQFLLGQTHRARGHLAHAETAYLKALDLQPDLFSPYLSLAEVYTQKGNDDQALAKLEGALRVNPHSPPALMLSGVLYERKGDFSRAQKAYEKVLAVNPRFAPAANKLAYLLAAHGGDNEKALQWAQRAKEAAPDEPHISDTLGWILYNRGIYHRALVLLKESAAKLPESPEVQYHLGMALLKAGDREAAKRSLVTAAAARTNFVGKEEAQRALAELVEVLAESPRGPGQRPGSRPDGLP